jgi:hypothetical protein
MPVAFRERRCPQAKAQVEAKRIQLQRSIERAGKQGLVHVRRMTSGNQRDVDDEDEAVEANRSRPGCGSQVDDPRDGNCTARHRSSAIPSPGRSSYRAFILVYYFSVNRDRVQPLVKARGRFPAVTTRYKSQSFQASCVAGRSSRDAFRAVAEDSVALGPPAPLAQRSRGPRVVAGSGLDYGYERWR